MPDVYNWSPSDTSEGDSTSTPEAKPKSVYDWNPVPDSEPTTQEYAVRAKAAGLAAGRSPQEHADILRKQGFSAESVKAQTDQYKLEQTQANLGRYPGQKETIAGSVARQFVEHGVPFRSLFVNPQKDEAEALQRFNAGNATDSDIKTIARARRRVEEEQGLKDLGVAGEVIGGLRAAPAVMGEYIAGNALAGKLGIGQAARTTLGGQLASHAGRMAVILPLMPSQYMDVARQKNIENGRPPDSWEGLPSAGLHAYANLLVLGAVFRGASGGVAGAIKGGLTGATEMAIADSATNFIDNFLPRSQKISTGYGTFEKLVSGDVSGAARKFAVDALTLTAFSGLHQIADGLTPVRAAKESSDALAAIGKDVGAYRKAGYSDEYAYKEVGDRFQKIRDAVKGDPDAAAKLVHFFKLRQDGLSHDEAYRQAFQGGEGSPYGIESGIKQISQGLSKPSQKPSGAQTRTGRWIGPMPEAEWKGRVGTSTDPVTGEVLRMPIQEPGKPVEAAPEPPTIAPAGPKVPPAETPPAPEIVQPALSGASEKPTVTHKPEERYYRVPDSKGQVDNVDAAIGELVGDKFAGKWFSRTKEGNAGYQGHVQFEFRNDRLGAKGDEVSRGEKDVLIGGTAPMYMHPALSKISYRGEPKGPQFDKLRKLIDDVNVERTKAGLDTVELEHKKTQVREVAPEKKPLSEAERQAEIAKLTREQKRAATEKVKKGDEFVLSDEDRDSLRELVKSPREFMILEARLKGDGFMEAGRRIGVSKQRAEQIQKEALSKIGLESLDKLQEMFAPKIDEATAADLLRRQEAQRQQVSQPAIEEPGRAQDATRIEEIPEEVNYEHSQYKANEDIRKNQFNARSPFRRFFEEEGGYLDIQAIKDALFRFKDWLKAAVSKGRFMPPGIKFDMKNIFPRFQNQNEFKRIVSDPQGFGRIPLIGWLFDPLRYDSSPEAQVFVANQAQKETGKDVAALWAIREQQADKLFGTAADGTFTMKDGKRGRMADEIEAHMGGGKTELTDEQKAWIDDVWTPALRDLQKMMREEGIANWVDDSGNPLSASAKAYFPRTAVGKKDVPGARTGTGARPGAKAGFEKDRRFSTEEEGADTIIYDPSAKSRVARFIADVYRVVADHRMAADPVLGGETVSERYNRIVAAEWPKLKSMSKAARDIALEEIKERASNPVWGREAFVRSGPAFQGKIYEKDIADKIEAQFRQENADWLKNIEKISAAAKGVMLGGDASFIGIQLLPLMFRHPLKWARAVRESIGSIFNPERMAQYLQRPENLKAAQELNQVGSSVGRLHDFMRGLQQGEFATRLPGLGRFYAAAGRAFGTAVDVAKIELWKTWSKTAKPEELRNLAEAIDSMLFSGRMEGIGLSPQRIMGERLSMLAPSYYRGGLNLIATAFQRGLTGRLAREGLGAMIGGVLIATVAAMKAVGLSDDETEERLNPARGKFLKVPVELGDGKKVEIGTSNIVTSYVRLLGMGADHFWSDKPIDTGADGNPILRWLRGKAAFAPRLATDIMTGKDYFGNRMEPQEAVLRSFEPLVLQQMLHGEGGTFEKGFTSPQAMDRANVADAMVSLFGFSSYPGSPADARNAILNSESRSRFGKDYLDLSIGQQAQVVKAAERREDYSQKKPPTAAEIERAMALEVERQSRLTRSIADGNRDKLNALSKQIPSYQGTLEVNGERVPMGRARMQRYEELLVEEYDKAIGRWDVSSLKSRNPKGREDWVRSSLEQAKERAKKRLVAESGK